MSLDRLAAQVELRFGLDLPPERRARDLLPRAEERRATLGLSSLEAYAARALDDEAELWRLAALVSNGWTWFFRDEAQLRALVEGWASESPARARSVWVAGCSTGEEAYSLAMLCLERGLDVRVVGTDLDRARLATARSAIYGEWSLRCVPSAQRERWFEPAGVGLFRARASLTQAVELRLHNLMDVPPWIARHDAVVCRNVLIHCAEPAIVRIADNLELALGPGGELVLGASDVLPLRGIRRGSRFPPPPAAPAPPPLSPRGEDFAALLTMGNLHVEAHAFDRAEAVYSRAAAVEPEVPELYLALGVLHRKRGEWARAASALRRAVFLDETLWPAWALLAGCLVRLGEPTASAVARERGERARRVRPRIEWRSCIERILPLDVTPLASFNMGREGLDKPRGG